MTVSKLVIDVGGGLLTLLGGGSVVLVGICTWGSKLMADRSIEGHKAELNAALERVKSDLAKETETHKLKLKKAELLFEKELQATSEFLVLYGKIMPKHSRPDMEWEHACEQVALTLTSMETMLEDYVTRHAPVLTASIREKLHNCVILAAQNKFAAQMNMNEDDGSLGRAESAANDLLLDLDKVQEELFQMVRDENIT